MQASSLEKYILLLSDSFFANLAIDTSVEVVFTTMVIFGNYNILMMLVLSSAGYTVATICNYVLGRVVFNILSKKNSQNSLKSERNINLIKNFRFLPIILLCSGIPFWGKFISLFAGFCKINLKTTFIFSFIGKLIYYLLQLFFLSN